MFDVDRQSIHASEFLYRGSLMVIRGNFKPPTLVTQDVISSSFQQFLSESQSPENKANLMMELTMDYLRDSNGEISETDFLERADMLSVLGFKVLLSDCSNHEMLINYLEDYRIQDLGLVIGVRELEKIITEKYEYNQDGRLLVALGELFSKNIRVYVYPALDENTGEIITAENMRIPQGIRFLLQYLLDSKQIVPVRQFNKELLHIYPSDVLQGIQNNTKEWMSQVPEKVASFIMENQLFGYKG